ncbi:MAG: ABC transporter permease [Defluviitaleaceae bacterium]|nr:ABC transporter permease [Defluviitaleaceae bacterium]
MKIERIPNFWDLSWAEIKKDKFAFVSFFMLIAVLIFSFVIPMFIDEGYTTRIILGQLNQSPQQFGRLGTDEGGRDMINMLFLGARNTFTIAFAVTILSLFIGYTIGLFSSYYGSYYDFIAVRVADFFIMVPTLMVIVVLITLSPNYGMWQFIVIMTSFIWTGGLLSIRPRVLQESAKDYVQASKTLGTPNYKIIFKKIFPNILSYMMVGTIISLAGNIGLETALTVIGFGLPIGTPSLGQLISRAMNPVVLANRLWQWVPAAFLVFLMTICIYGVGQAVSRAANPKQRR